MQPEMADLLTEMTGILSKRWRQLEKTLFPSLRFKPGKEMEGADSRNLEACATIRN